MDSYSLRSPLALWQVSYHTRELSLRTPIERRVSGLLVTNSSDRLFAMVLFFVACQPMGTSVSTPAPESAGETAENRLKETHPIDLSIRKREVKEIS